VQEWLPTDHLALFIVDIVNQLNLSSIKDVYAGRGSQDHMIRAMQLSLLFYGYAPCVVG